MGAKHQREKQRSNLSRDTSAATVAKQKKADDYARGLADRIAMYERSGITSLGAIAGRLTDHCIEKPRGGYKWSKTDVKRLLVRLENLGAAPSSKLTSFFNW